MWVAFLPLCMLYSSYSNCGNHNLNFWLMCFWNLYNKCCINIELFSLIFTKIKSICNRYCFNLWKKYFINKAQGMAKMRSVIHFCSMESASLPHCYVSRPRAFITQKVPLVPRPLLHVYLLRKCKGVSVHGQYTLGVTGLIFSFQCKIFTLLEICYEIFGLI